MRPCWCHSSPSRNDTPCKNGDRHRSITESIKVLHRLTGASPHFFRKCHPPLSPAGRSRTYLSLHIRQVPGRSATAGRKRPVRGLNPSHLLDRQAGTPASSQGSKDGRIRTLCVWVGTTLLSQEHILDEQGVWVSIPSGRLERPATSPEVERAD
jgi:hypothetical protein